MNDTIIEAIENQKMLIVRYSAGERTIEPYAYGLGTSGNYLLRGYQIEGASQSGNREGWKLFKTDDLISVEIADEDFAIRSEYKRGDKAMANIMKEI